MRPGKEGVEQREGIRPVRGVQGLHPTWRACALPGGRGGLTEGQAREGGPGGRALTHHVSPGRTTSTGRGAGRTTWRPSARGMRGASRRTRSPFVRPSWRRRTQRCARRWRTCARSWASARTSWLSTRPGMGPCRWAAGGRGPDRPSPQRPTFLTSALYQTQQHDGLTFWGVCLCVCVCVCVCVCAPVWSARCVCVCLCPCVVSECVCALVHPFAPAILKRKVPCFYWTEETARVSWSPPPHPTPALSCGFMCAPAHSFRTFSGSLKRALLK